MAESSPAPNANRAGWYQRQQSGHQAFLPTPLPPDPPLAMTGVLPDLLSQADRALGRLDGSVLTLPNDSSIMTTTCRRW